MVLWTTKKEILTLFYNISLSFSWQSLQRHEFPQKSLAKYSWMRNIGEMYKITETFCASPPSLWAALQREWILLCFSSECTLYTETSHLTSPTSSGLIPYWGVLFHIHNVASCGSWEHFFPSKGYSLSSIHIILHLGSPFPSEIESKKTNSKSIKFRWDDFVGLLLKLKQNKTRPTRFFT